MISWIQNHLIRHGRWIFLTLLAVLIVAFVFTIGNTPGCTTDESGYEKNLFYGYDLNAQHEMEALGEKVSLSAVLNTGRPIQNQQQFQSQLIRRITLLHLADEIGIPAPSQDSLASYIQSKAAFRGPDGQFSRDAYIRFIDNIESNPNARQDLFAIVLEEDYRIEQVDNVLSGPGYFLPSEALSQVQLNETMFKLTTAETSYSAFEPKVEPNEDELMQLYTNNIKRYEIPERIRASYVKFKDQNYIEHVGDFSEEALRDHFVSNRARFVADYEAAQQDLAANNPETPASPTITFEDVRAEVTVDLMIKTAQKMANKAAQDFALTLYRNAIKKDSPAFQELLDEGNLTMIEIPPYTAAEATEKGFLAEMLGSAFALTEKRYFSDAYRIEDGYGVLLFSEKIPPETPAYEAVAEAVKANYSAEEKRRLFNEEGERLKNELSARLDAEATFTEAAEELGLTTTTTETFKLSEAPRTVNQAALQRAQNMQQGELSSMITSGDSGIFVYIEEKTVPEIEADNEQLTQTSSFLKRYTAFISANALLNELVSKGSKIEEVGE